MTEGDDKSRRRLRDFLPRTRTLVAMLLAFLAGALFVREPAEIYPLGCSTCGDYGTPDFLHLGHCMMFTPREQLVFVGVDPGSESSTVVELPISITNRWVGGRPVDVELTFRYPRGYGVEAMESGDPLAYPVYSPSSPPRLQPLPGATRALRTLGNFDYITYSVPRLDESTRVLRVRERVRLRFDALAEVLEHRGQHRPSEVPAACDLPRIQVTMSAKNWGPYDYEISLRPFQATSVEELEDGAMDFLGEVCSGERATLSPLDRIKQPRHRTFYCAAAFLPATDTDLTLVREPDGKTVVVAQNGTWRLRARKLECPAWWSWRGRDQAPSGPIL